MNGTDSIDSMDRLLAEPISEGHLPPRAQRAEAEVRAAVQSFDPGTTGIVLSVDWGRYQTRLHRNSSHPEGWIFGMSIEDVGNPESGFCKTIEEVREFMDGCQTAAANPDMEIDYWLRDDRPQYVSGMSSVSAIVTKHRNRKEFEASQRVDESAPAPAPAAVHSAVPHAQAPAHPAPALQEQAPAIDPRERPAAEFASLRDRLDALNQ